MVNGYGSWLKGAQAAAGLPWAMSHEPSTINNRVIDELFGYIL